METAPAPRLALEVKPVSPAPGGRIQLHHRIFDAAGRLVTTLVNEELTAGTHQASWDGKDLSGRAMAAGVYLYRLETAGQILTRRMTLVK